MSWQFAIRFSFAYRPYLYSKYLKYLQNNKPEFKLISKSSAQIRVDNNQK